jgi:hypothetical protein
MQLSKFLIHNPKQKTFLPIICLFDFTSRSKELIVKLALHRVDVPLDFRSDYNGIAVPVVICRMTSTGNADFNGNIDRNRETGASKKRKTHL